VRYNPNGISYRSVERRIRDFLYDKRSDLYFHKSRKKLGGPVIFRKVPAHTLIKLKNQLESEALVSLFNKKVLVKLTFQYVKRPIVGWTTEIDLSIV